jgi:hypothetical protein
MAPGAMIVRPPRRLRGEGEYGGTRACGSHCGRDARAPRFFVRKSVLQWSAGVPPASVFSFVGGTIMGKRPDLREFLEVSFGLF